MSQQAIGQGVVEIVASSEGLEATLARAVAVAERGGQAVGRGISEGAAKASEGLERVSSSVDRYVRSVEKEIASTSLSRSEFRAWEAMVKKIPDTVYVPLIARMNEAQRAKEAEAAATKEAARIQAETARAAAEEAAALARSNQARESFLQGLREQIQLAGRTADETLRYRAAQLGAAADASPLITQLTNIKAAHANAAQAAKDHADAEARAARAQAENRAFVAGLERQARAIGKTRSELLEMEAAQRGVSAAAAPHIAALRAQEQSLERVARATNAAGMSQKAYDAALRGVPAQITDIVVSLQGGQAPLTVLLQQGGQLKDMFNGVLPAFRALGSELLKLATNPVVLLVAGVAALAAAFYKGSQENDAYVKALATTGNRAGVTAGQLQDAARAMSEVSGTQAAAAEALAAMVDAGGVQGLSDLTRYAKTAQDAQKYLGIETKETAKAFADLAKDPLKASERLTEQMGYLTHAQYQQIKALVEANDKTKAAEVAQKAYDDAVRASTAQVVANLGFIERSWNAITSATGRAIDAAKNVGRPDSGADRIANMQRTLDLARNQERITGDPTERLKIEAAIAAENRRQFQEVERAQRVAEEQALQESKTAAQKRVDATLKETRDKKKIREDELEAFRRDAKLLQLTAQQIADGEKAINEKYKDAKGRTPRAYTENEGTKEADRLRQSIAALKEQQQVEDKLTQAQRDKAKFEQEIADIKEKKTLTADQKSLLAQEQTLRTLHEQNVAESLKVKWKKDQADHDKEAAQRAQEYLNTLQRINNSMDSRDANLADQLDSRLNGAGRGDRARERGEEERRLRRDYENERRRLRNANDKAGGSETFEADMARINQRQEEALAGLRNYYAQEDRLRGDWQKGYTAALENYYDSAKDVAARVQDAMTRGLAAVEDAFVSLATTGKVSFSGLANSIISDIVRISVRMAIANSMGGGGGGGWLGSLIGAAFSYFTGGTGGGTAVNGSALNTIGGGGTMLAWDGGYTGPGGKYQYAGEVHKGEVVFSQEDVQAHGGPAAVERMRKRRRRLPGYATGGVVGGSSVMGPDGPLVNIVMEHHGTDATVEQRQNESGGIDLRIIVKQLEAQMGANVARGQGPLARGMESRYNLKTA